MSDVNKLDEIKARLAEYAEANAEYEAADVPSWATKQRIGSAMFEFEKYAPTDLAALVKAVETVVWEIERTEILTSNPPLIRYHVIERVLAAFAPLLTTPERTAQPQGEERGA
jgi:hypothetical protein